jgi:hypothetical protein
MFFTFVILLCAVALFLGMLLCFEIGRRVGINRLARDPEGVAKGSGPVEAAVLGLLGLLIAFTFSGAASRFEARRHLITQEANAIGTAYLRIDLLPGEHQAEMRQLFRRYLDLRATIYQHLSDAETTAHKTTESANLQEQIWNKSMEVSRQPETSNQAIMLFVPALNDMFDITATRAAATQNHPPMIIFVLLVGLSFICSLLGGYVMCSTLVRSWFYIVLIACATSLAFYVILDLEFPRHGLIRVDNADQMLIELRKNMP